MIVIFDLDGTLALIEHRRHFVEGDKKDWPAFFAACVDDTLNLAVVELFRILKDAGHCMWIMSGRSDEVEQDTVSWLYNNDIEFDKLIMRKHGDHQPDDKLKKSWLDKHFPTKLSRDNIMCVFDDRKRIVDMWRNEGLACLQVAPGDF